MTGNPILIRRFSLGLFMVSCCIGLLSLAAADKKAPSTKSIRGQVLDARKNPLPGAKVFIVNLSLKTTAVVLTDGKGVYAIHWLNPKADYEVHAEYGNLTTSKKTISAYLSRLDNLINFELGDPSQGQRPAPGQIVKNPVQLRTPDGMTLHGDWYLPAAKPGTTFPAMLLIHDYGSDRSAWNDWIREKAPMDRFAVLNLDLRGHGESLLGEAGKTTADPIWRSDPAKFPVDVEAALNWLKSQSAVDVDRMALVGAGFGADLAFAASGKYEAVRSVVALSPGSEEALGLTRALKNFQPHSILYLVTQKDALGAESARQLESKTGFPVRVQIFENSSAMGITILKEVPGATDAIVQWLKNTM
jgi:pimeloyl-ACP methyl ester carboxylesterase